MIILFQQNIKWKWDWIDLEKIWIRVMNRKRHNVIKWVDIENIDRFRVKRQRKWMIQKIVIRLEWVNGNIDLWNIINYKL